MHIYFSLFTTLKKADNQQRSIFDPFGEYEEENRKKLALYKQEKTALSPRQSTVPQIDENIDKNKCITIQITSAVSVLVIFGTRRHKKNARTKNLYQCRVITETEAYYAAKDNWFWNKVLYRS